MVSKPNFVTLIECEQKLNEDAFAYHLQAGLASTGQRIFEHKDAIWLLQQFSFGPIFLSLKKSNFQH